jgi:hypothetical protein
MEFNWELLIGTWVHAHEYDGENAIVFVPDTTPLPPSRGRTRYTFLPGNKVKKTMFGPSDKNENFEGTWSVDALPTIVMTISNRAPERLTIISIDRNRLVFERIR